MIDQGLLKSIQENNKSLLNVLITYQELSSEDMIQLAQALKKNTTITHVEISRCNLTDSQIAPLLMQIVSHPSIKSLNLDSNKLGDATAKILAGFENLGNISLKENQLTDAGLLFFSKSKMLIDLNVKKNNVSNACIKKVFFKLAENKLKASLNSKKISLDFTSQEFNDADVKNLVDLIETHVKVPAVELCLKNNDITDKGAFILAGSQSIEALVLVDNPKITSAGFKVFFSKPNFKKLNLFYKYYRDFNSDIWTRSDSLLETIRMLERNDPNEKILDLSEITNGYSASDLPYQMLLDALAKNRYISCLRMRKGNDELQPLFQAFISRKIPLEEITIIGCTSLSFLGHGQKQTNISALAALIEKNKSSLKKIHFESGVTTSHPDVKNLFQAIGQCSNIREFILSIPASDGYKVVITVDQAKYLFSQTQKLESVELSHYSLSIPVIQYLSSQLANCTHLKKINFSDCDIDNEGMKIYAENISRLTKLEYVNFSGNPLSYQGNIYLSNALFSSANHLKELYARRSGGGKTGFDYLNWDDYRSKCHDWSIKATTAYSQLLAKTAALQCFEMPEILQPQAILKALSGLMLLRQLYVEFYRDEREDKPIIEFAKYLAINNTLKSCTLFDSVHEKGGLALEDALKLNVTLQEFSYFRTSSCTAEIDKYLERNRLRATSTKFVATRSTQAQETTKVPDHDEVIEFFSEHEVKNSINEFYGNARHDADSEFISHGQQTDSQITQISSIDNNNANLNDEKAASTSGREKFDEKIVPASNSTNLIISKQPFAISENEFLTNPILKSHISLIENLSKDAIDSLKILNNQHIDLNKVFSSLSHLEKNYEKFEYRLLNIEKLNELDAQSQAEIADIQTDKALRMYYKTLKILLGQTFLAAHVISSGAVEPAQSMQATVINGVVSVAGSLCLPAAPFLNFASMLVSAADNISICKAMHNLSSWADFPTMAIFASLLARRFTQIQKSRPAQESSAQDKKWLKKFARECEALFHAIQNGQPLTPEKKHATLVAKKILDYMKQNARPENSTQNECVTILLRAIMGDDYVHDSSHRVALAQQTRMTTVNTTTESAVISTTTQTHPITREEWETMQKRTVEAERKAEETQRQLEVLRKQTVQPNSSSLHLHDNGDGTVSLKQQEQMVNTSQGPMPLSTVIKLLQTHVARLESGMGTVTTVVVQLQEALNVNIKNSNDDEIPNEQLQQDLFRGNSFNYQQQKK